MGTNLREIVSSIKRDLGIQIRRGMHPNNFDLVDDYESHIDPEVQHFVHRRKIEELLPTLSSEGAVSCRVLEVGCGSGKFCSRLIHETAMYAPNLELEVFGIEISRLQAQHASQIGTLRTTQGSMLRMPFRTGSFDVVVLVNSLHHLDTPEEQTRALSECARILRSDGLCVVHEMSMRNPIFRFYMKHVFWRINAIDNGAEVFIKDCPFQEPLRLERETFFSWLPQFLPATIFRWLLPVNARLDRWFPRGGAHVCWVARKVEVRSQVGWN